MPRESVERVVADFESLSLGDPRRAERVRKVLAKLAEDPTASIPAAMGSEAALEGAYRLVNNSRVTFEDLHDAHARATAERALNVQDVIVIHDTTNCSFPNGDPEKLGYLQTRKAGFLLHYALVLDAQQWRRPLGVIHAEVICRKERSKRGRGASGFRSTR